MTFKSGIPYMIRNDGKIFDITDAKVHPYIWNEPEDDDIPSSTISLLHNNWMLKWFYDNTRNDSTRTLIRDFLISCLLCNGFDRKQIIASYGEDYDISNDIIEPYLDKSAKYLKNSWELAFEMLNNECNQEFLRMRMGNMYFNSDNDSVAYFRVSSAHFNWYNIIWDIVYNSKQIQYVTCVKDRQGMAGRKRSDGDNFYEIEGEEVNYMSAEDFITAKGNPIIEGLHRRDDLSFGYRYLVNHLRKGKTVQESTSYGNIYSQILQYRHAVRDYFSHHNW